jgi:hypothetical protein
MKKILLFLIIPYFFIGCEKKTDWQLQTQNTNLIVVDGIITNEPQTHTIIINYPITQLNEKPKPLTGATVLISDEDSTFTLFERPVNSGKYRTDSNFSGQIGKNYSILINHDNKVYTAKTYMVAGYNYLPDLEFIKNARNKLSSLKWNTSQFNAQKASMWEILFNWSHVEGYTQLNPDSCKARLLFYTLPTLDVSEIFAPEIEKVNFPSGTVVNLRRYSLNPEHAEFIRSLLSETTWQGGIFSSVPANVPTNLSEGAVGFFGACEVVSNSQTVP